MRTHLCGDDELDERASRVADRRADRRVTVGTDRVPVEHELLKRQKQCHFDSKLHLFPNFSN